MRAVWVACLFVIVYTVYFVYSIGLLKYTMITFDDIRLYITIESEYPGDIPNQVFLQLLDIRKSYQQLTASTDWDDPDAATQARIEQIALVDHALDLARPYIDTE